MNSDKHTWGEYSTEWEKITEIIIFILDFNLLKYRNAIVHWEQTPCLNNNYPNELLKMLEILMQVFQEVMIVDMEKYLK